ncbi:MAG: indole-3-glycerol phosphate synthase TrpC [Bacteroidaceae bacterium]|nr:indole-3-glycerol phosphate synthase TrpC [Bacteroidaceae bacterium]
MQDILQEIVAHKRIEVARQKEAVTPTVLHRQVEELLATATAPHSMRQSLAQSASGIIAEFKRKSPSKGWIKEDGLPDIIPPAYAHHGAAALSILTDEHYFGGSLRFLQKARPLVGSCPILRKDFIIDEYQLFQAKVVGADAVLLIAADLTKDECRQLAQTAHQLQLETLLEVHTEAELDYLSDHIDMVGVNNRNLGTFHTDVQNSFRLSAQLPQDYLLVSESGISQPQTVRQLREAGFRGFLIGETFMRTPDPGQALQTFIQQVTAP